MGSQDDFILGRRDIAFENYMNPSYFSSKIGFKSIFSINFIFLATPRLPVSPVMLSTDFLVPNSLAEYTTYFST